jgi:hypothetical protein
MKHSTELIKNGRKITINIKGLIDELGMKPRELTKLLELSSSRYISDAISKGGIRDVRTSLYLKLIEELGPLPVLRFTSIENDDETITGYEYISKLISMFGGEHLLKLISNEEKDSKIRNLESKINIIKEVLNLKSE